MIKQGVIFSLLIFLVFKVLCKKIDIKPSEMLSFLPLKNYSVKVKNKPSRALLTPFSLLVCSLLNAHKHHQYLVNNRCMLLDENF